jgi:hypothetical protein
VSSQPRSLSRRERFALEGRIDFAPLFGVLAINLLSSFLSYLTFNTLAEYSAVQSVISLGSRISPSVDRVAALSAEPSRAAFVLSVAWLIGVLYLPLLMTLYWPFSKTIKVAVDEWRKRQSPDAVPDSAAFMFVLFFVFVFAWGLGDLGVLRFPTLYNGLLLSGGEQIRAFVAMINSALMLPILAWFSAFATPMMYWCPLYLVANWRSLT